MEAIMHSYNRTRLSAALGAAFTRSFFASDQAGQRFGQPQ
jgi:hypothetical protein